ncbi:MAG: DUF4143 domain-containing protein [Methanomassiliicoccaceae archaeon]|nr:DUF4143 domain-containing protein [Methanomassiliicoccaceae archaeon]MCL2146147.1 DUF4143 domain-containing protein [Methanomassiliicoccaceae archaeon]
MKQQYLDRIVDRELEASLKAFGAVLLEGPKWCGKTRTAMEHAASVIYLQDINKRKDYLKIADIMPSALLEGDTPRLIDEWQTIQVLWDGVRFEVDKRGETGQFILTGSAVPKDDSTMHTGTGRISRLFMRPMTLFESLESNGSVSLGTLFDGEDITGTSQLTIEKLAFALVRGGWPASIGVQESVALRRVREYIKAVINTDISRVDNVERNPERVRRLLRSLARNTSTMAKLTTINSDMAAGDETISDGTIASYMNALRRIFVIEDLPAWSPDMRSKTALRTSAKRHFVDPSIAAAVLRISPKGILKDFNTFGLLFESLCIRDLRVYAQALDGEVSHYHDKNDLEADAVIELYDGRWGAVEVKMGGDDIEEAAKNLMKLRGKIDTDSMGEPSFLMVITAGEYAYRRKDGVYIVPIGCLKD